MTRLKLDKSPSRSRLQSLAVGSVPVQTKPTDGKFGAGMLADVSAITKGEALGHGFWIDEVFLGQVANALAVATNGSKSRFTHPGLSADGLAKALGVAIGGRVEGDQVLTDLHFYASAHRSPDGDLAGYVMERAGEDPQHFGTSIMFVSDRQAEDEFMLANGGHWETVDDGWESYDIIVGFTSPDPLNVDNLPHVRLLEFLAIDVVDDPAANPSGMFHRDLSTIDAAQGYLDFALGLSDRKPTGIAFDVDPERARLFFQRYAAERGFQLPRKGNVMPNIFKRGKLSSGNPATDPEPVDPNAKVEGADATPPTGAVTCPDCGAVFAPDQKEPTGQPSQEPTPSEYAAQHQRFVEAFGAENGSKWFFGKESFEAAQVKHYQSQLAAKDAEITALKAKLTDAETRLAAIANSGVSALESSPAPKGGDGENKGSSFSSLFKVKS
ncbi:MAG: hypothetical protein JSS49_30485 [Planctomycetes bacterium]|nr:hypothetical protein [Planctomycetota bacterium]